MAQVEAFESLPSNPPWWCHCCGARNRAADSNCRICARASTWMSSKSLALRPLHTATSEVVRFAQLGSLVDSELTRRKARDTLLMNAGLDRGTIDLPAADGPVEAAARRDVEQLLVAADIAARHPERRVGGNGLPGSGFDLFEKLKNTQEGWSAVAGKSNSSSSSSSSSGGCRRGLDDVSVVAALVGVTGEDSAQRFARLRRAASEREFAAGHSKNPHHGRRHSRAKALKALSSSAHESAPSPMAAASPSSSLSPPPIRPAGNQGRASPPSPANSSITRGRTRTEEERAAGVPFLEASQRTASQRRQSEVEEGMGMVRQLSSSRFTTPRSGTGTAHSKERESVIQRLKHGGSGNMDSEEDVTAKAVDLVVNDPDSCGWTPLHVASRNGSVDLVRNLLLAGTVPNAQTNQGWRSLHLACAAGHVEVVRMLLPTVVGPERGGTVWRTNHELNTPLHLAAAASGANNDDGDQALGSAGSAVVGSAVARACEIINLLLECGAELEAVNFQGRTPLHVASETAHGKRVCLALMAKGADMDKLDSEGWTPRGLAEFLNHTQTVDSMVDSLLSKKGKGASAREFLPAPSYRSSFFVQASKDLNTHCANLADSDFRKATYAENDNLMRGLMTEAKFSSHLNSHGPQQTAFDYDRNREHFTGTAATAAYGQTSSQRPATQSSLVRTSSAAMTATATMGRSKSFSRESSVSPLGPPLTSASLERMDRDNGNSSSERDRRGTAGLMVTRPVTSQSTAFRSGSGGGGGYGYGSIRSSVGFAPAAVSSGFARSGTMNFDLSAEEEGRRRYPALKQPFEANPLNPSESFRLSAHSRSESRAERKRALALSRAATDAASGFIRST